MTESGFGGKGFQELLAQAGGVRQSLAGMVKTLGLGNRQRYKLFSSIPRILGMEQEAAETRSLNKRMRASGGQTAAVGGAIQALNFSNLLSGITLTPNMLFLLLFVGMTLWLGFVYWIRHNEPLANSVLGTGAAHSATGYADRRLIAGIKRTMPVVTSATTGEIYVPNTPSHAELFGKQWGYGPYAGSQSGLPPVGQPAPMPNPPIPTPLGQYAASAPYPAYDGYQPGAANAYMVPIQHAAGPRVKMIVNR